MPRPQRRKARDESRGVIGRTVGESKPSQGCWRKGARGRPERRLRRPQRRGLWAPRTASAASAGSSTPRTLPDWPPAGCATPTSTRRASPRPPDPAYSPAATITPTAWAPSSPAPPLSPATPAGFRAATGFSPRFSSTWATTRSRVGEWHLAPGGGAVRGRTILPMAAWQRDRALLRLPRRGDQPVVPIHRLRQPPGRSSAEPGGGLPSGRRPDRQGDPFHP